MTEKEIVKEIIRTIALIALGRQNRLYVEDLSVHLYWQEQSEFNLSNEHEINGITVREFVRISFAELGIEIEFCGRGQFEKGVIIDIDEERLDLLNIDKEPIKFGQTVVKIVDQSITSLDEIQSKESHLQKQNICYFKTESDFKNLITRYLLFIK